MTPREAEIHARLYPVVATAHVTAFRDRIFCPSLDDVLGALFTEPCADADAWCARLLVTAGMVVVQYRADADPPARHPRVPHDAGRKYVYRVHGGDGVELELVDMLDDERPTAPDRAGFAFLVLVVLGACVAALVAAGAVAEHVRATGRAEALMCAAADIAFALGHSAIDAYRTVALAIIGG